MTTLAEFRDRYGALVVAACEWRAMQADAEVLAARVFAVLDDQSAPPDLARAYRVIEKVVLDSYVQASASRSMRSISPERTERGATSRRWNRDFGA